MTGGPLAKDSASTLLSRLFVLTIVAAHVGCTTIKESTRISDTIVSRQTRQDRLSAPDYRAAATLGPASGGGQALRIEVARLDMCRAVEVQQVDRSEVTEKHVAGRGLGYTVGVAGAGFLGYSLSQKPIDKASVALGGLLSLYLLDVLVTEVQAIDSEKPPVRTQVEIPGRTAECGSAPASKTIVRLENTRKSDRFVEVTTNEKGMAELPVEGLSERLFGGWDEKDGKVLAPTFSISVGDKKAAETDALAPTYLVWIKEAQARAQAERDENARKLAALKQREIKTGRCEEGRQAGLRRALEGMKHLLGGLRMGRSPELYELEWHAIEVATPAGRKLGLRTGVGGEFHFFFLGYDAIQVEMVDSSAAPISGRAPYGMLASNLTQHHDSRIITLNSAEAVGLKLLGEGCAIAMAFRKL